VLGGNFDQKNLSAMAAETAIAVMCFLFVLLYLLSAFSYYQLFIVNNAIDPANALLRGGVEGGKPIFLDRIVLF